MTYTVPYLKSLPAPSIKKILRERGLTMADIARAHGCRHSVVSRVVSKQIASAPIWERMAEVLNDTKARNGAA